METSPLVVTRTYNAPVHRVWQALTDVEKMRQWYFNLEAFKPEVGFKFNFLVVDADCNNFLHVCEVTEVIPENKLTYSWKYDGYDGISYVTFELFAEDDITKLVLTHTGLDTFPPTEELKREKFEKGWNQILGTSLKEYVENNNYKK
ncbi:SRPBCC domain-containing protein [Flavobacterium salilacus subsp. salilacus]|uniref:SRPBCC family protein n=1 Tax=Flavobacterium TaxID=237 RepID=UPI0010754F16|nr:MULTISPECIES: SRPBCC domain-containing protein [Flavobacterium]KAF2519322.1 SRPBCC domain-containing protein [Flavobacterium salilacus subsp. salilacus]MBE1613513.1 SRPBCC domain-containing protein [Flavobacterium sp. SaA2.13]